MQTLIASGPAVPLAHAIDRAPLGSSILALDLGTGWVPRAGSQSYPSPAAEAAEDGATTVWFAPEQPEGVGRGNWIQTDPEKGWFTLLRLYSPLPSFYTKEWRPSEIELVQ